MKYRWRIDAAGAKIAWSHLPDQALPVQSPGHLQATADVHAHKNYVETPPGGKFQRLHGIECGVQLADIGLKT